MRAIKTQPTVFWATLYRTGD